MDPWETTCIRLFLQCSIWLLFCLDFSLYETNFRHLRWIVRLQKSKVKPRMAHNQLLRALRHPADTANEERNNPKVGSTIILLYLSTLLKHDFVFKKSTFHINSHCWSICDVQLHNVLDVHQRERSAPAQPTLTLTIVQTFYHPRLPHISLPHISLPRRQQRRSSGCQSRMCVRCPGFCWCSTALLCFSSTSTTITTQMSPHVGCVRSSSHWLLHLLSAERADVWTRVSQPLSPRRCFPVF